MSAIKRFRIFLFMILGVFLPAMVRAGDPKVLSVLHFQNTSQNTEYVWFSRGIPDMLTTGLSQSDRIRVVERENLQRVLNEQKLALAGLTDEKSAVKVGKLLNANYLVLGGFIIQGNNVRIDARLVQTETGGVKSAEVTGPAADIISLAKELTEKLLLQLTVDIPGNLQVETSSRDAAKYYYTGLEYLDRTNIDMAIEQFNRSKTADPFYSRPQTGLEEAYKFLKDFRSFRMQRELSELVEKMSAYKRRIAEKPFRTYADVVKDVDFNKMTSEERDRFNQKNTVIITTQTPAQAAWMTQTVLLEITGKQREIHDRKWDEIGEKFDAKEKEFRNKWEADNNKLHDLRMDLTTNKNLTPDEKDKKRGEIDALSDAFDKKRDTEEKTLDDEENRNDSAEKADEKELAKRNAPYLDEMVAIAERSRTDFRGDSFLPEILYMELLAFRELEDYAKLRSYSEQFLMAYPKYRLIEAVEDFYQTALDKEKESGKK